MAVYDAVYRSDVLVCGPVLDGFVAGHRFDRDIVRGSIDASIFYELSSRK